MALSACCPCSLSRLLRGQELLPPTSPFPVLQETGLRLVNGSTMFKERVEFQVLGIRGTPCASRWDLCIPMFSGATSTAGLLLQFVNFSRGTRCVWRHLFHWDGTEACLKQWPVTALGPSPCSHGNAAAVLC